MPDFKERVAEARSAIRAASVDGVQRRTVNAKLEARASGESFRVVGHAAVFDDLSENLGGFRERIEPGAFADVLSGNPDVRALFNHDPNLVLARTKSGTLTLAEDDEGLAYDAEVADTSYGRDLRVLLDRGDVSQSSFAFRVADDVWEEDEESGALIRTIQSFSALFDVSPVTYPAYPTTDAGAASSRSDGERESKADALEQDSTAPADDGRVNDDAVPAPWRREAVKRRIRLRQTA